MKNLYEKIKYDSNNKYHNLELNLKDAIKRVEKLLNDERIRKLNNSILV